MYSLLRFRMRLRTAPMRATGKLSASWLGPCSARDSPCTNIVESAHQPCFSAQPSHDCGWLLCLIQLQTASWGLSPSAVMPARDVSSITKTKYLFSTSVEKGGSMNNTSRVKPSTTTLRESIERWTIERLDLDVGMARIESVPMRSDRVTPELLEILSKTGLKEEMDQLSLWNVKRARTKRMPISRLIRKLNARDSETKALSENMVFWIVRSENMKTHERVFHATQAARQLSKELYRKVARREETKS